MSRRRSSKDSADAIAEQTAAEVSARASGAVPDFDDPPAPAEPAHGQVLCRVDGQAVYSHGRLYAPGEVALFDAEDAAGPRKMAQLTPVGG